MTEPASSSASAIRPLDLEPIKARVNAYFKGGWRYYPPDQNGWAEYVPVAREFYAEAARDIPALLAEVERLRSSVAAKEPINSQNEQAWEDLRADGGLPETQVVAAPPQDVMESLHRVFTNNGIASYTDHPHLAGDVIRWACEMYRQSKPSWAAGALSAPAPLQEPTWREKFEKAVCVIVPLGCERQPQLSRICERGTPCCGIHHGKAAAPAPPALERLFPIQRVGMIPWSVAERAYERYAQLHGRSQSLERMAERGGFGLAELGFLLRGYGRRNDSKEDDRDWQFACEHATMEILKALADVARLQTPHEEKHEAS